MKLLVSSNYKPSKIDGFSFAEHQLVIKQGGERKATCIKQQISYIPVEIIIES